MFVHGRAQGGRVPTELKAEWLQVLNAGMLAAGKKLPETVDVVMPFYGDRLDELGRQAKIPLSADIQTRGAEPDKEFQDFQAEFVDALRLRAGVTTEDIQKEYGGRPDERGVQNWAWVQAIARALDKKVPGMGPTTLEAFTRDVYLYITRPGVRSVIDGIVSGAFVEQTPTILVSHSLGTVVSYSILSNEQRRLNIPLFVTLGSPLAVRAVRDPFRPIVYPNGVKDWYNAFDPRDIVALYPLDQQNFPVTPNIRNNGAVRNGTDNRHGISGYLNDSAVVDQIIRALES